MILANEQVAQLLERKRVPAVYRVHPQPDPLRVERLIEKLHALGVPTPPLGQGLAPSQAGEMVAEASRLVLGEARRRGHGGEAYTSLVLRSLMQASYSDRNSGHAGLGSPAYCHFTSPIRRYPDLLVHRALLAVLGEGEDAPRAAEAREVAWHCSESERESARIERDADDICAAYLLRRELGERGEEAEFEGEISGTIRAGAFVAFGGELGDVYEGFVPARTMGDERFELNETETALLGRESGTTLRLGDPTSVRVTDLVPERGRAGARRWLRSRSSVSPSGGRRHKSPRPPQIRSGRKNGGGDRPAGLRGEVAAQRQAQMTDSYAVVEKGEVWLRKLHIPPYEQASDNHEPERPRKLLLHKGEIERLIGKTAEKGLTLIPLRIYFKGPRAKVELALARGKEGRHLMLRHRGPRRAPRVEREFKSRMR